MKKLFYGISIIYATINKFIKKKDDTIVIDVRREDEWDAGHLPCAKARLQIHEGKPSDWKDRVLALTDGSYSREIMVYCRSGRRSDMAKKVLEKNGFTKVINGGGFETDRVSLMGYCN